MKPQLRWPLLLATALLTIPAFCFEAPAIEGRFERILKVSGQVELEVRTGLGNITVRTGDASSVEVRGTIKTTGNVAGVEGVEERIRALESKPSIEQEGNVIKIGRIEDEVLQRNLSISYDLVVPVETRLVSKTGGGDLSVEGIRGPVDANSDGGDFKISRVGAGVQIATENGDATIEETGSGDVEVSTGAGDVKLSGHRGAFRVTTDSGDVTIQGSPAAEWKLKAGSGDVEIHLGTQAAFELHAHTNSGSIDTDVTITLDGAKDRRNLRGKVGGGGPLVDIDTSSGNVRID